MEDIGFKFHVYIQFNIAHRPALLLNCMCPGANGIDIDRLLSNISLAT